MTAFPQIIVGTYEEFVLGYKPKKNEDSDMLKLVQTFATHSHQASVRCVAAHGFKMASSGADEYINIYDMHAMEVSTVINYHNATVTCLEFTPDGSHLVSTNQNGDIAIFRCRDWKLVKLWKEAHKHANGITSVSVHPSGSLVMTAGADNIIRFWNLVKGRHAYATNFSKKCSVGNLLNFALWSSCGDFYVVCIGNKIEIYKTETAAIIYEIQTKGRATCAAFTKKNLICVGSEEGFIEIHNFKEKKLCLKEPAHKTRIKNINYFSLSIVKNEQNKVKNFIVSTESKGIVKLWILKKKETEYSLELKGEVDCDCRITCLTTVFPKHVKKEKSEPLEAENSITNNENKNNFTDLDNVVVISKKALKKKKGKLQENGNLNSDICNQVENNSSNLGESSNKVTEFKSKETHNSRRKRRKSETPTVFEQKKKFKNRSSSSSPLPKKKNFSKSFNSGNIHFKRMSGKWSVEDDS